VVLEGVMAEADSIFFSPSARSAVWFSAKSARLQLVTGLPDEPSVQAPIDMAAFPEPIYSAAVSDEGTVLLAASIQAVWAVQPDRGVRMALSLGEVRSLTMMRNGRDAIAVDGSTGTVYKLQDVNGSPVSSVIASGLAGIGNVTVSSNGESLIVTHPADRTITILEFESGRTRTYPTSDQPVVLQPLRNRDTFLISARPRQAGWIFYLDGEDGRTAFVPASVSSTDQEQ